MIILVEGENVEQIDYVIFVILVFCVVKILNLFEFVLS